MAKLQLMNSNQIVLRNSIYFNLIKMLFNFSIKITFKFDLNFKCKFLKVLIITQFIYFKIVFELF